MSVPQYCTDWEALEKDKVIKILYYFYIMNLKWYSTKCIRIAFEYTFKFLCKFISSAHTECSASTLSQIRQ